MGARLQAVCSMSVDSTSSGRLSLWRDPQRFDASAARDLIFKNLEPRGQSPDEITARDAYLDLLGVRPGERVLDVGCGSGVVTRDLARRVVPGGRAVGVDPGTEFLAIAKTLAQEAGLGESVRRGDRGHRAEPRARRRAAARGTRRRAQPRVPAVRGGTRRLLRTHARARGRRRVRDRRDHRGRARCVARSAAGRARGGQRARRALARLLLGDQAVISFRRGAAMIAAITTSRSAS